jgi:hypothetical protein
VTGPPLSRPSGRFQLGARPPAEPPAPASLANVVGGVLFIAAVVVGTWFVIRLARGGGIDPARSVTYEAYYPEGPSIRVGAAVMLGGRSVGEVLAIDPGLTGVQLGVFAGRVPEVGDVRTLTVERSPVAVPEAGLEIHREVDLLDGVGMALTWTTMGDTSVIRLWADVDGSWMVIGRAGPDSVIVNGALAPLPVGAFVRPGDRFTLGVAAVEIGALAYLTRVRVAVDTTAFSDAAEALWGTRVRLPAVVGPGSVLSLGGALGLGTATATLIPSFRPLDHRVLPIDTAELRPSASRDPLQVLSAMADYLTSPSAVTTPPNNRFQRMVADVNATATNLRSVTGAMSTQAQRDSGIGTLGRLLFSANSERQMDAFWQRLAEASGTAGSLVRDLRDAGQGVPGRMGVISNLLFRDGGASIDTALVTIARAAQGDSSARGVLLNLLATPQVDRILANVATVSEGASGVVGDLNTRRRTALGVTLGDTSAAVLTAQIDSVLRDGRAQLNSVGSSVRMVGLGVLGLLVLEILGALF